VPRPSCCRDVVTRGICGTACHRSTATDQFWVDPDRESGFVYVQRSDDTTQNWTIPLQIQSPPTTTSTDPMFIGSSGERVKRVQIPPWSSGLVTAGMCEANCHGNTVDSDTFCVEVVDGYAHVTRMDKNQGWSQPLSIRNAPRATTTEPLPGWSVPGHPPPLIGPGSKGDKPWPACSRGLATAGVCDNTCHKDTGIGKNDIFQLVPDPANRTVYVSSPGPAAPARFHGTTSQTRIGPSISRCRPPRRRTASSPSWLHGAVPRVRTVVESRQAGHHSRGEPRRGAIGHVSGGLPRKHRRPGHVLRGGGG
jgi:hypothetical protein